MRFVILAAVIVLSSSSSRPTGPQAPCAVRGAWMMVSVTVDGKPEALGQRRSMKVVSASHVAFMTQEPGAQGVREFGGGTYRVTETTYIERLDFFSNPDYLNREIRASCRVTADRWYHTFQWPVIEGGKVTRQVRVEEVWRRVD